MATHDPTTNPTCHSEPAIPVVDAAPAETGKPDFEDEFDHLVGDFWRAWGAYHAPFGSDDDMSAKGDAVREAFFSVVRVPSPQVRHVAQKLRICLTQSDRAGEWADGRIELMLASILLDLDRKQFDA